MAEKKKTVPVVAAPTTDKKKALETAIARIEKDYGKGTIMRLGDDIPVNVEALSTGSLSLDLALGIGGAIVLTGTDISAGRCVGLTACIAASLLQMTTYANKIFPELGVMPLWLVLLIVIAVGAVINNALKN